MVETVLWKWIEKHVLYHIEKERGSLWAVVLIGIVSLVVAVFGYVEYRGECGKIAGEKAALTAACIAWQVDEKLWDLDGGAISAAEAVEIGKRLEDQLNACQSVAVLDASDGTVLYASDDAMAEVCLNLQKEGLSEGETRKIKLGGADHYILSMYASQVTEWKYYVCYDMDNERMPGAGYRGVLFLWLFLLTCFCIAMLFYTRRQPENQEAQELFGLKMMYGNVEPEEMEKLHLKPCKFFATAVVMPALVEDGETQEEEAIDCFKLAREMPEELKEVTWLPPVCNMGAIFCVLGENDEDILRGKLEDFHRKMQEFVGKESGRMILMGVSAVHGDYKELQTAYKESVLALTMRNMEEDACYFGQTDIETDNSSYNSSYEKEIQTHIKAMDKEKCYKVINEFAEYLQKAGSQDKIMIYSLRMINTILLTAIDIRLNPETLFPDGLARVYQEIVGMPEPVRVRKRLKSQLIDPILQARNEHMKNHSYSMLEEIERKIRETKGGITLTECADALGVHHTYIWKVLKAEKGKSFSDCVEAYKLEEAKRLLLQTDMSVAEISAELNYTNAQNFIRFFSKSTGVTPGKFRKESQ
ncbi:MAG: helix-turn-helix transcriptional regulator [Candidatus Gastranaerophilales bacterium]|nr:helix-turn-helix transcriptional regulator [Candidatus Gastranaerophilales bacterium]